MGEFSQKKNRVGERGVANNGLSMEIIAYRTNKDIDVMFEDGTVVTHKTYTYFRTGRIPYPDFYKKQRLGETGLYNDLQMEIIEYRNASDIDIRFSNGYILKHTGYTNFTRKAFPFVVSHYHEKKIASNGMMAEIIECRSSKDIDIQFEDGTIMRHKTYRYFRNGYMHSAPEQQAKRRVGMKKIANCGMEMEIIAYRKFNDIDVKFSNGEIKEHVTYDSFMSGGIRSQSYSAPGQIVRCNNGMRARLSEYRSATDVDVMFEDGTLRTHIAMSEFRKGSVRHPAFNTNNTSCDFHSVQLSRGFYNENGMYYYSCTFPDGTKDLLTSQEVMERQGIKPVF